MRQIIYETTGRAREFSELALNLFDGCEHGCVYCYSPLVLHKTIDEYSHPQIRVTPLDVLKCAKQLAVKGESRRVLIAFTHDPYTPCERDTEITRKSIMALHEAGMNVIILTKGGYRSVRDFNLLTPQDAYAATLTCTDPDKSRYWEPNAALPESRYQALKLAWEQGIETWVSLEPVIYPADAMEWVKRTKDFVGHFKIGKMNYHPHGKSINWRNFGWEMKRFMDSLGVKYYFKRDLLSEMGIRPEEFKQTWICR